jgi:uncharacterized membrane protein
LLRESTTILLLSHLIAALSNAAYALYNVFIKKGSLSINPILGGVILQIVAALLGTILLVALSVNQKSRSVYSVIEYDRPGIMWSIFAGLAVGIFDFSERIISLGSFLHFPFVFRLAPLKC